MMPSPPLIIACEQCELDIVEALLENVANPDLCHNIYEENIKVYPLIYTIWSSQEIKANKKEDYNKIITLLIKETKINAEEFKTNITNYFKEYNVKIDNYKEIIENVMNELNEKETKGNSLQKEQNEYSELSKKEIYSQKKRLKEQSRNNKEEYQSQIQINNKQVFQQQHKGLKDQNQSNFFSNF